MKNIKLSAILASNEDREIRFGTEKSKKNDDFWGWGNGTGGNQLGKFLMEYRKSLPVIPFFFLARFTL